MDKPGIVSYATIDGGYQIYSDGAIVYSEQYKNSIKNGIDPCCIEAILFDIQLKLREYEGEYCSGGFDYEFLDKDSQDTRSVSLTIHKNHIFWVEDCSDEEVHLEKLDKYLFKPETHVNCEDVKELLKEYYTKK